MRVTYTVNGEPAAFETQEEEDLREIAREIEEHVRTQQEALKNDLHLPIRIADGLLNSLADESDEIALGELTGPA